MTAPLPRRRRVWWRLVLSAIVAGSVGAVSTWSVLTLSRPAEDPLEAGSYTTVRVAAGEVGSDIRLNSVAEWDLEPVGANRAAGVVTSVAIAAGDEVGQGSTLYTVDLRPVVIGQGVIPTFRSIGMGTKGPDVAQLQGMLTALGFYAGPADGDAGAGTVRGIVAWQKALGVEQTGVVEPGDIIFVPTLPLRVSLDTDVVSRGATVVGGEKVVSGLPPTPRFSIPVTDVQAGLIPSGSMVDISSPTGATWTAIAADQLRDAETGSVTVNLQSSDGAAICDAECASVPVAGQTILSSRVVTVPTVSGLVVPSAALITDATGQVEVIDATGTRYPVTVQAAARGMAVITGVNEGLSVRVPANDDETTG